MVIAIITSISKACVTALLIFENYCFDMSEDVHVCMSVLQTYDFAM